MPWTTPETFTAGQTLTAASMNAISGNARMGRAVFTNEAARDAAITAPEEGMIAYLTAPTVPAATGANTAVPSGITTIYNGSAWVCVTEVGAYTDTTGTTQSGTYTATLAGGGTNPSVTLSTGTTALVMFSMQATANASPHSVIAGVAVSGATTLAPGTTGIASAVNGINFPLLLGHTVILTGLTAGVNTFTLQYAVSNPAVVASFLLRHLVVKGVA